MGGFGFIFVVALYVYLAYRFVAALERKWLKSVAIIAVLLIPSADAVYGRIKLRHMCEAEAGLKVYRPVEHVEGFMDDDLARDYWIKEKGFRFVEDPISSKGTTTRYFQQSDGKIVKEERVLPKSQYRLRVFHSNESVAYTHHGFSVENTINHEILATHTWIAFNGGWAERLLAKFSDAGGGNVARCSNLLNRREGLAKLISSTLKH